MRHTFFGEHEGAMFILPLLPDKTRVLRSVDHSPSNAQVYVPDRGWEHCSSLNGFSLIPMPMYISPSHVRKLRTCSISC